MIGTTQFEQIRRDQAEEGRKRLTVRPGYSSGGAGKSTRSFTPKGHDAILKRMQDTSEEFVVRLNCGRAVIGKLVARDKFTITIKPHDSTGAVTIYKSAISAFGPEDAMANGGLL